MHVIRVCWDNTDRPDGPTGYTRGGSGRQSLAPAGFSVNGQGLRRAAGDGERSEGEILGEEEVKQAAEGGEAYENGSSSSNSRSRMVGRSRIV